MIRYVSPNDLRRTFASWLVQNGVPLHAVAKLLGHSSTRMVERGYAKLSQKNMDDAIAVPPAFGAGGDARRHCHNCVRRGGQIWRKLSRPVQSRGSRLEAAFLVEKRCDFRVPRVGIEPTTRGFSVRCSTN